MIAPFFIDCLADLNSYTKSFTILIRNFMIEFEYLYAFWKNFISFSFYKSLMQEIIVNADM